MTYPADVFGPIARGEAEITFLEYARAGVPLTIVTLAAGAWMLN